MGAVKKLREKRRGVSNRENWVMSTMFVGQAGLSPHRRSWSKCGDGSESRSNHIGIWREEKKRKERLEEAERRGGEGETVGLHGLRVLNVDAGTAENATVGSMESKNG